MWVGKTKPLILFVIFFREEAASRFVLRSNGNKHSNEYYCFTFRWV